METKKEKNQLVLPLVIAILVIIGLVGFICYDKGKQENKTIMASEETKKETAETDKVKVEEKEECNCEEKVAAKAKCYGTYYVNGDASQGVYQLKEDGTYQVEGKEEAGIFTIHDNTIAFLPMKHTTGPKEVDPIYDQSKNYVITDDCSKVVLLSGDVSAELVKQN